MMNRPHTPEEVVTGAGRGDPRSRPLVAVVVVNWNGVNDTIELLESLLAQTYECVRLFVVDNGSDGEDADTLVERFGDSITVVRMERNLGCGGGYNAGVETAVRSCSPDYFVIMNNDMAADPRMVEELVRVAEVNSGTAVVGAKVFYYDHDGRDDVLWSAGGLFHPFGWRVHSRRGDGIADTGQYDSSTSVEWVSGATMLFSADTFSVAGPFNDRHVLGYEDMEFCRRATSAGLEVVFAPRARSWHKVGVSARKAHITYTNPAAYYEFIRGGFPRHVYVWQRCLFPLLLLKWGLLYLIRSRDPKALTGFVRSFGRCPDKTT